MQAHRAKALLIAAVFIVILAGAYTYWWTRLANSTESAINDWTAQKRQQGWLAQIGAMQISGFPLGIKILLPEPALSDPAGNSWLGPKVTLSASVFSPHHIHIAAPGQHSVTQADHPAIVLNAGAADSDLTYGSKGVTEADVALRDLHALGYSLDQFNASLLLPESSSDKPDPDKVSLSVEADISGLAVPTQISLPLPGPISHVTVTGRLLGPMPANAGKEALAQWSNAGGTIEIDNAAVAWPPLGAQGNGTLALDKDLQPLLSGTLTGRGLGETLDALAKAGQINPTQAQVARLAFGVLAKAGPDGVPEVTLPITIQNQVLSLGPVAVTKLPPIKW